MVAIYVTSVMPFSGKSAVCIGLGQQLRKRGLRVGYIKPLSATLKQTGQGEVDEDALLVKQTFGLSEDLATLAPVPLSPLTIERILGGEQFAFQEKLQQAYATVAQGKDAVMVEGASRIAEGSMMGLPAPEVASMLAARVLIVAQYDDALVVDKILHARHQYGDSVAGAILNAVPRAHANFVEKYVVPFLNEHGIKVFGILPHDKMLAAVSVLELAEGLNGEILCCPNRGAELVEDLSVGAMSVDSALTYFRRRPNKAVITGGDRPDIQLAALETSTKCLILTGNLHPSPLILGRAEELDVPIILVRYDTLATVKLARQIFDKSRFHHPQKIQRFGRLLEERVNFAELYQELGIS